MQDQPQERASNLKALADAKFGKETLSNAEELLLEKVSTGERVVCGPNNDEADPNNNPKDADSWGPKRQIRAELVSWLCRDSDARTHVHWRGIQVYGADVAGSLDLSSLNISFPLAFRQCRLKDAINLTRSEVSQLDLQGSLVHWILADGVTVRSDIILRNGFEAVGEVRLPSAQIGGNLDCDAGTFANPPLRGLPGSGDSLRVDRINVKGSVFLRRSAASGKVSLAEAQIGGDLDCSAGTFANPWQVDIVGSGSALNAYRIIVKGALLLRDGFTADGAVNLEEAQIGGHFDCRKGDFRKATLNLTDTSTGSLIDSGLSDLPDGAGSGRTIWPLPGELYLDGFVYGRIYSRGINVANRIEWLGLQPRSPFRQQPYIQLAKVLKDSGNVNGAFRVLAKKEELRRSSEAQGPFSRLWSLLLKVSIGYGYFPGRAVSYFIVLSLLGWIVYGAGYRAGAMAPTDKDAYKEFKTSGHAPAYYPAFSPLGYSVENSFPVVKLGQADKWQPDPGQEGLSPTSFLSRFATSPRFVLFFLRLQILLGWVLATLIGVLAGKLVLEW